MNETRRKRGGTWTLALVWGLPLSLMLLAWLMYETGVGLPRSTHNHGILLEPPFGVADALPLHSRGWTLLLPVSGACTESCRQRLYRTRQVHVALGREAWRLQRLHWAVTDAPEDEDLEFLQREHPGVRAHRQDLPPAWETHFRSTEEAAGQWSDYFYLADPQGYLIMAYKNSDSGKGLLEDLRFLLRVSRHR